MTALQTTKVTDGWVGPDGVLMAPASAEILEAAGLKAFFGYWLARSAGRIGPKRADIDLRDMAGLLPHLHFYDVVDGGRSFYVRVVGTAIVASVGSDHTKLTLTDADQDLPARRAIAIMRAAIAQKAGIRTTSSRIAAMKPSVQAVESLWLPLSEDGTTVSQILACSMTNVPAAIFSSSPGS